MKPRDENTLKTWLPVAALGAGGFIFVTTELLPIGLLPDIAASLGRSEASTGLLLTVYAWAVALVSLPLTILCARLNRRTLLLIVLSVFIIGNGVSALAGTFAGLMAARLCIAMAHAVFWAIATPLAARLAPPGGRARALACIVVGTSLATVLGVPLGTLLGHQLGWRLTFVAVAALGAVIMALMAVLIPSEPPENAGNLRSLPDLLANRPLLTIYLITALAVVGQFTAFTYFTPFMQQIGLFSERTVALLLLVLGGSGLTGSMLGSRVSERAGRGVLALPLAGLSLVLALLPFAAKAGLAATVALCFCWGALLTIVTMLFQIRVLNNAPRYADVGVSVYSSTFNVGIGGGALIGSRVFDLLGIEANPVVAAVFMAGAAIVALLGVSKAGTDREKPRQS